MLQSTGNHGPETNWPHPHYLSDFLIAVTISEESVLRSVMQEEVVA